MLWIYTVSKVVEFMDTVLMVIRKKQNQVTFLHLFHHASILNIWWWVQTFLPGGQGEYQNTGLQIRRVIQDNSKTIFVISKPKHTL